MPWLRPAFRPTGSRAIVMLVAFADDTVSGAGPDLGLSRAIPAGAPVGSLEVRLHRYTDSPAWIDGWRTGPFRNIAAAQLGDVDGLDAATCCYSIRVEVDDPADLAHLQLVWAVAGKLAEAGSCATLDVYAATWHPGAAVAALSPHRPFAVQQEVTTTCSQRNRAAAHAARAYWRASRLSWRVVRCVNFAFSTGLLSMAVHTARQAASRSSCRPRPEMVVLPWWWPEALLRGHSPATAR
jgi:hypothetical protein